MIYKISTIKKPSQRHNYRMTRGVVMFSDQTNNKHSGIINIIRIIGFISVYLRINERYRHVSRPFQHCVLSCRGDFLLLFSIVFLAAEVTPFFCSKSNEPSSTAHYQRSVMRKFAHTKLLKIPTDTIH
jgi:hypothetical protein